MPRSRGLLENDKQLLEIPLFQINRHTISSDCSTISVYRQKLRMFFEKQTTSSGTFRVFFVFLFLFFFICSFVGAEEDSRTIQREVDKLKFLRNG